MTQTNAYKPITAIRLEAIVADRIIVPPKTKVIGTSGEFLSDDYEIVSWFKVNGKSAWRDRDHDIYIPTHYCLIPYFNSGAVL